MKYGYKRPICRAAREHIKKAEAEGSITFTASEFCALLIKLECVGRSEKSRSYQSGQASQW